MQKSSQRHVIVFADLSLKTGRDIFAGISRYTHSHPEWWVRLLIERDSLTADLFETVERAGCDGAIICTSGNITDRRLADKLLRTRMSVVCMGAPGDFLPRRTSPTAFIRIDNSAVAAACASYLMSLGSHRCYAFLPTSASHYWSNERGSAFKREITSSGLVYRAFPSSNRIGSPQDRGALGHWLLSLPKPCAVLAATDTRAAIALEVCRDCGLSVPKQVLVLGVDNDASIDDFATPTLSSLDPNHEDMGFQAAQELDALMSGKDRQSQPKHILAKNFRLVERESTVTVAPAAHLIDKALAFIDKNATRGIKVSDVVNHLGVSRRLADLRFREFHGKSILATITERRLKEVCRRLESSRQSIVSLSLTCGFDNVTYLKTLFKRQFGMTMRAWRVAAHTGK